MTNDTGEQNERVFPWLDVTADLFTHCEDDTRHNIVEACLDALRDFRACSPAVCSGMVSEHVCFSCPGLFVFVSVPCMRTPLGQRGALGN